MRERAVVTGPFGNTDARTANASPGSAAASLPTGVSPGIQHVNRLIGQVAAFDLHAPYRPVDRDPGSEATPATLIATAPASAVLAPALEAWSRDLAAAGLPDHTQDRQRFAIDADEPPPMDPAFTDAMLEEIPEGFDLRNYLESLEQRLIVRALEDAGGTVSHAARLLGLRRTTLVEKLRKYSLTSFDGTVPET
jgi:hypothetical protein